MAFLYNRNDIVRKRGTVLEGWISNRFILNDHPLYCVEYSQDKHEWLREEDILFVAVIVDTSAAIV